MTYFIKSPYRDAHGNPLDENDPHLINERLGGDEEEQTEVSFDLGNIPFMLHELEGDYLKFLTHRPDYIVPAVADNRMSPACRSAITEAYGVMFEASKAHENTKGLLEDALEKLTAAGKLRQAELAALGYDGVVIPAELYDSNTRWEDVLEAFSAHISQPPPPDASGCPSAA